MLVTFRAQRGAKTVISYISSFLLYRDEQNDFPSSLFLNNDDLEVLQHRNMTREGCRMRRHLAIGPHDDGVYSDVRNDKFDTSDALCGNI